MAVPVVAPNRAAIPMSMRDEPLDALLSWATSVLMAAQYTVLGEPRSVRKRTWSAVVSLPTDRGLVWVKANARPFCIEASLVQVLAECAPEHVLHPIAVRGDLGWFITPDGGPVVEDSGPPSHRQWSALLTGYGELQRAAADRIADFRRIGLPDMTPPTLVEWFGRALGRIDVEPHVRALISAEQRHALDALAGPTAVLADELGASPIPISVEHNDLHSDNVFAGASQSSGAYGHDGLRIFDWGDAVLTHPYICLGRAMRLAAEELGALPGVQVTDLGALRDNYLRLWLPAGATEISAELRRTAEIAERLAFIPLAASWLRLPVGFDPEWAGWYASFLLDYLEAFGRPLDH